MRDPEMTFEVVERDGVTELRPFYFRNDYAGVEQWSYSQKTHAAFR